MNHATVTAAFYISLLVILPIGLILMIMWGMKIYKRLGKSIEQSKNYNLQIIAFKALVLMTPGLLLFILFSIPAIYFNYLLKQESFCKQMIEANKFTKVNSDLQEKCGSLDIDELLRNSKPEK